MEVKNEDRINGLKSSKPSQWLFNIYYLLNLYSLGALYSAIEANRKLQWFSKVRLLNEDIDLPSDLSQVNCLITGGSRGIGLETTKTLLKKGAYVIIASSKKDNEQMKLKEKLNKEFANLKGKYELWYLDLTKMSTVNELVKKIKKSNIKLNLLINNAGIMFSPYELTVDGFESQLATNYLGHWLLTYHLLPILNQNRLNLNGNVKSRVVNVSSSTHFCTKLRLNDLNSEFLYSPYQAYSQSKLSQIMFTKYFAKNMTSQYQNVAMNSVHPGVVHTELYTYVSWVNWMPWLADLMFRTPKEGAETVLFAAVSPELKNQSGLYLEDCSIHQSSSHSKDASIQKKLFELTRNLLGKWLNLAD